MQIHSYTIYHSPNAYLGTVLLRRALADLPDVELVRQPIFVPRTRGLLIADMLGGKENRHAGSYNREDCRRWAERHAIPFSYPPREVFAARAYYAAATDRRDVLDEALFRAAWVEGLDMNEPETIRWAADRAGIDGDALLADVEAEGPAKLAQAALDAFNAHQCPGVPTVLVAGQRFFVKDRCDWIIAACRDVLAAAVERAKA